MTFILIGLSSVSVPLTRRVLVSDMSLLTFTTVFVPEDVVVVDTWTGTNTTLFQLADFLSLLYMAAIMPDILLNV